MRRRWLGVLALVATAIAIAVAVAVSQRGRAAPGSPKPIQARPSHQDGDTADLMRRLERQKHVQGVR